MKLTIIRPLSQQETEISWAEINTPNGNFVIQAGHAATTFVLSPKKDFIYCFITGKQEALTLESGGIFEVTRDGVILLL